MSDIVWTKIKAIQPSVVSERAAELQAFRPKNGVHVIWEHVTKRWPGKKYTIKGKEKWGYLKTDFCIFGLLLYL